MVWLAAAEDVSVIWRRVRHQATKRRANKNC